MKKLLSLLLIIAMAITMCACGNTSSGTPYTNNVPSNQNNDYDPGQTQSEPSYTIAAPISTTAQPIATTAPAAEEKMDLRGLYLDDAVDILKGAGLSSSNIEYYSDNGKKIIVKNNWMVINQYVEGECVYLECSKERNDGIIEAAGEVMREYGPYVAELLVVASDIRDTARTIDDIISFFR